MSGSSPPPGRRFQPTGGGGDVLDCDGLEFSTTLESPDPDGVASLGPGDLLEVTLIEQGGVTIIGVVQSGGTVVGSVVSDQASELRACLLRNYSYDAKVVSVLGGVVRVRISSRK